MNGNKIGKNLAEGNILRLIIVFAFPLLVGNILQLLQQTINAFWIGRFIGETSFSAVTISFPIIFILISVTIGFTMAATTLIAQYKGANNLPMIEKIIKNSFMFTMLMSIVFSVIGIIFNKPILRLMVNPAESPEVFSLASGYLLISYVGLIFIFGFNLISAILRGLGDSWTPLWFLIFATVFNAALDPVLILGIPGLIPRLGIYGSALATLIAQVITFVFGIRLLQAKKFIPNLSLRKFRFDFGLISTLVKIGLPSAVQQTIVSTGVFIITIIVSSFGVHAIAALGVGSRIDSFAFMPAMALSVAVSAFVGQNLGAGKKERVYEAVRVAAILSISTGAVISLVCFIFAPQIVHFFLSNPSDEVLRQGIMYLRIVPFGYLGVASIFITNGALLGAGDTVPPMIFGILSFWLLRIPLSWILSKYTPLQSTGIWVAIAIGFLFSAFASFLYYRFGPWEKRIAIKRFGPQEV